MNQESESSTVISKTAIEGMLPHRGIMLLPDSVTIFPEENRAIGIMTVPDNEITRGHFGVLPGVLQVEFAYQVMGVLCMKQCDGLAGVAGGIRDTDFHMMAKTGDTIAADVRITDMNVIGNKKGSISADASIYKIGDETKQTVTKLIVQAMPQRVFERMTRTNTPNVQSGNETKSA